jgi:SNF2 family DNA or RNA helicase
MQPIARHPSPKPQAPAPKPHRPHLQVVDDSKLTAAHYLLRPFVLRRLKEEVEQSLPPKVETRIGCHLSEMQTFWYRR